MSAYEIRARANPRGGWSLVVDGIGVSQVRHLDQAEQEMRAAVVDLTGQSPEGFTMHVKVELSAH